MIKRKKLPIDSAVERQIITGMIISDKFLTEILSFYRPDLLNSYIKKIAEWCVDYFERYKCAPGKNIEEIYREKIKNNLISDDEEEAINIFLVDISNEFSRKETFNAEYILDKAEKHFRALTLQKLKNDLSVNILNNNIDEAESLIADFRRITRNTTRGVDPYSDEDVVIDALRAENSDLMFRLPGDLGNAVEGFYRGDLFAIVGASNVGKTWWLSLLAQTSMLRGFNTAFFSGEMSVNKMTRRIITNITAMPKNDGPVYIPVFDCIRNQNGSCDLSERESKIALFDDDGVKPEFEQAHKKYKPCVYCKNKAKLKGNYIVGTWFKKIEKKGLTMAGALKKQRALKRTLFKRGGKFRLFEFPSDNYKFSELKSVLLNAEYYDNFVIDSLITDYADKFKSEKSYSGERDKLYEIWSSHKSIAQEKKILVCTASQSNTARTGKDIKQGDWADDIRKLAIVDTAISIYQKPEDKASGIMRVGVMKKRDGDYDQRRRVIVLQNLKIGMPYIDSYSNDL